MEIAIITITEYASMPGRFKWAAKVGRDERFGDCPGHGPEAAAAMAVDRAIQFNKGGYSIFGPREVLACIPADIRNVRAASA